MLAAYCEWLWRCCCPAAYTAAKLDEILARQRQPKPHPVQTSAPHAQYVFDLDSP